MSDTGMDRKKAMAAIKTYTERFDTADINIKLKIDHTYRVAGIAERIARSLELDELGVDFCWLLGLLHDIGRFEQLTRYGTFKDAESVDHAELGADILFSASAGANGTAGAIGTVGEPLINTFIDPSDWLDPEIPDFGGWDEMAGMCETAIRFHNKLALPDDLDSATLMYSNVLRDADKADIFRVLTEPPYDKRNERIIQCSQESITATPARDDVMRCVREHRCVPKTFERTDFESLISQCCMAFELVYPASREIVSSQGYLEKLMSLDVADERMAEQLATLRSEMKDAWEE